MQQQLPRGVPRVAPKPAEVPSSVHLASPVDDPKADQLAVLWAVVLVPDEDLGRLSPSLVVPGSWATAWAAQELPKVALAGQLGPEKLALGPAAHSRVRP